MSPGWDDFAAVAVFCGAVAVPLIVGFFFWRVMVFIEGMATERGHPSWPPPPRPAPGDVLTVEEAEKLAYCTGCGHNHRTAWFTWRSDDQWQCLVCCRNRSVP